MRINLIGECDKRPVLYTLMKVFQELGDVLIITDNSRLIRLSDTRENYGHYQNTMVAVTQEGLDDFLEDFLYDLSDFNHVIVDNITDAEADYVLYVQGYKQTDWEKEQLEYIDSYGTIQFYTNKLLPPDIYYKLEEFESLRDMCPMGDKLATAVCSLLSPLLNSPEANLHKIAMKPTAGTVPKPTGAGKVTSVFKKGGKH